MLCTANTGSHTLDVAHHLHAASKAFYANRPYLVNRNVAMRDRFRFFNAMVTPVACFGAAHRKVYKQDLCKMDIVFRRLLRSIVGPPGEVDWTLPWHEILHHWNERVKFFTSRHGLKSWSAVRLGQYWKFAHYISITCQGSDGLCVQWIGSQKTLDELDGLLTHGIRWFSTSADTSKLETGENVPRIFLFGWANSMIFFRSLTPDEREM